MNIRTRLIILFASIVALILLVSSVAIYFFSADYREDDFYQRLQNKGRITARLLIEVDEVDENVLKRIEENNPISLSNEKITIYDFKDSILYTSDDEREIRIDTTFLNNVRLDGSVKFQQGSYEGLGFLYADKYDRFVVVVAATDIYGFKKMTNLKLILIVVFASSIIIILFSGAFFVGKALQPISNVIKEVDHISGNNLHLRVAQGKTKDEIWKLADTFNGMLTRIEAAFNTQKQFIANASHEIRNPIAAVLVQIDVCLMQRREIDDYENALRSLREDITNLKVVSNRLLLLAQASIDGIETKFGVHRVDEILWEAKTELQQSSPDFSVNVSLQIESDDDTKLRVRADEQLLKGAFLNLMENGCKYSRDQKVNVTLHSDESGLSVVFADRGIGIPPADLPHIFQPFFRGSNVGKIRGTGIGLSLVWRIITTLGGDISINNMGIGTEIKVSLPVAGSVAR
ncbi:MAG TPA: HAMP domain-containing sensor histidine kinase [Cyclobacteriaceae bacterium]|nr:HAMP domain-containing sensor histidine kinase [Cyclobacteriaceae bacterium]